MNDFFGIHFGGSHRSIFLLLLPVLIIAIIKNFGRLKRAYTILANPKNGSNALKNFSLRKQLIKSISLAGALVALFIALLQPQWGKKGQTITQEGRDILILVDISRSMTAQDVKPTRMDFAKLKIRNLLTKLAFERVGLILFSGSAFVQCPLTSDHNAFLMFLDHIEAESISSGTTSIAGALEKAITLFGNSPDRKNKLVLLVTDGEDFSTNLEAVKNKAGEQDIKLFALGIGTKEGAPIPIFDASGKQSGFETDDKGAIILSSLNEKMLEEMCSFLNGTYAKAIYQDSDLDKIVNIIKKFEREKFADKTVSLYEDQYPWLLGLAFVLLMLEWIV